MYGINSLYIREHPQVAGAHVPERKSPKNRPQPTGQVTGVVTAKPSPAKKQDRLSKPPDMKAWRQAQENLKTIDYEKESKTTAASNPEPKPVPKPVKKTAILSNEPDAVKTVTPTPKNSIIPTRKAKGTAANKPAAEKVTEKVAQKPVAKATKTPTKCILTPKTARKTAPMVSQTSPKATKPSPKQQTPKPKKVLAKKTAPSKVIAESRRERSPTPKRTSPEIDDERVYDVDREIPTDALREPEEISSDEGEKNVEEDTEDPATWCITDDFIDLT